MLAQLGPLDHRGPLVEQVDQAPDQPGLALAALTEQHHVVAGEQGPLDLGQHGVVVADDAGKARSACTQPVEQVVAQLFLHGLELVPGGLEFAEGARQVVGCFGGDRSWRVSHPKKATPVVLPVAFVAR